MNDYYSGEFSKYEFYNFHDQKKINKLAERIIAEGSRFPILLLIGEIGMGRSYFLQSVVYNLKHSHPQFNFDYAPLDLRGFEIDKGMQGLKQYAKQQLSDYGDLVNRSILKEIIRARPKEEPVSILDGIQISVQPWLAITIRALRDIWTYSPDIRVKAPKSEGKERFHELMERICQNRKVILHVLQPELIDMVVQRWLFDEMRRLDNLQIAFSIESEENRLKDYCLEWRIPFEEITFDNLNLQSLTAVINQRFSPNQFPDDFYQLLWKYSHGNTKKLAIAFQRLISSDCIFEKRNGWVATENSSLIHGRFSDELYEPIDEILHNPTIGYGLQLYEFLLLLALCKGTAPANLIFDYLRLNIQEQEELDDVIEKYFIDTESPWLIDHGYNHPSFQGDLVYSFTNACYTSFMLERIHDDEKKNRAASLFKFLSGRMNVDTKLKASIMLRLADLGDLNDEIEKYNLTLRWWVDNANANELKDLLIDQLKKGHLTPLSLWKHINLSRKKDSSLIMLALLDAYKAQPEGIPAENLISFLELRSKTLFYFGKYPEALSDACLADGMIIETEFLRKADIKNIIGLCLKRLGKYEQALPYLKYTLETNIKFFGDNHPITAISLDNFGTLLNKIGKYRKIQLYSEKALEMNKKILKEEHSETIPSLNTLRTMLSKMDRYLIAQWCFKKALEINKNFFGEEHPDVAIGLDNLGTLLKEMGEYKEAKPYLEKALKIKKKIFGEEHSITAVCLDNLGTLLSDMGKYKEAKPYFERALEINKKVLGEEHYETAITLNNIGSLYKAMGKYKEAKPYFERALEISKKALGDEHSMTIGGLSNLGSLLWEMGKYKEAKPYFERALEINKKVLGEEHPITVASLRDLGALLNDMGKYYEAEPYLEKAIEYYTQALEANREMGYRQGEAADLGNLGSAYRALGEVDKAVEHLKQALIIFEEIKSPNANKVRQWLKELISRE